jgi:Leucine-rich repeat (LRR) protein
MATFITSKGLGQTISIGVNTSTGYWKYNHNGTDSGVFSSSPQTITVANVNGEFTIISCLSDGTVSGDITYLELSDNQITSFDGTGLTKLTNLRLNNNGLTSLDNFIFPASLTQLILSDNLLTSFDGVDLVNLTQLFLSNNGLISLDNFIFPASLTQLILSDNLLTSFDGTGLSGLTSLDLTDNPLTTFIGGDMGLITELNFNSYRGSWNITTLESIDITGMDNLQYLYVENNTSINNTSVNNSLLAKLAANELANDWDSGEFITEGERTEAGTADYDYLINEGWTVTGADLVEPTLPPTFITSKSVGQNIEIGVTTTTGYWKYNHNGTTSSVLVNGSQTITVANANGEFTLIPCLSNGTVSGDITEIYLNQDCNIITFDGTGLSGLTYLDLYDNQLTSFDGTGLSGLTTLYLADNVITSFDGTDLTSLLELDLSGNQLTTIEGFIFPTSLTALGLGASKDNPSYLTSVDLSTLVNLVNLNLEANQLTSFDPTGLTSLTELYLQNNQLTTLDITGLNVLQYLNVGDNLLTPSANNSLLAKLAANELANGWDTGEFSTSGGRTSAGTTDYDYLIANGWTVDGADLVSAVRKLRVKGVGQIN